MRDTSDHQHFKSRRMPAQLLALLLQAACFCAAAAQLHSLSFQRAVLLLSLGQPGSHICQLALQLILSRLPLLLGPAHTGHNQCIGCSTESPLLWNE